jgi:hypothetical protein
VIVSASQRSIAPLQLAAADLSRTPLQLAKSLSPEDFFATSLTNVPLVVWQSYTIPASAAAALESFAAGGGIVLFLPEPGPASPPFAGVSFSEVTAARTNSAFTIGKWNELEGPFANTEEGFGVPLGSLEVFRRAGLSGNVAVLASFSDGAPFLARKAIGKGEVYFCATSADPNWSTLMDGAVLVPMLQRMFAQGANRVNAATITDTSELRAQDVSTWKSLDSSARNPKLHAGIYRVGNRFVAVNRPAAENDLQPASADAIRGLFASVPFQMHQESAARNDRLQGEVWRMFVTLMLIFLLVEAVLILPSKTSHASKSTVQSSVRPSQEVLA